MPSEPLRFFDPREPETGWLSNFYRARFRLDSAIWPTVEHYFQAQKFAGRSWATAIRFAPSPRLAKLMGRSPDHGGCRTDWDEVKQGIMLRALVAKFIQNPELTKQLIKTNVRLVEASPDDAYWGEGSDGQGKNTLGRLLMALRATLPEADHQNMLAQGDLQSLQQRCEQAAWALACDDGFDHQIDHPFRLTVNVLTAPLYGQSARQIAQLLEPILGRVCHIFTLHQPMGGEHQVQFYWHGDENLADSRTCLSGTMALRLGQWPLYSVAVEHEAGQRDAADGFNGGEIQQGHWRCQSIWALLGEDVDPLTRYYFPPVAQALALELEAQNDAEQGSIFVVLFAQGGAARVQVLPVLPPQPPSPNPKAHEWQQLACSAARGSLPLIQAEFARLWKYWGVELPLADVLARRPGAFDEDPISLAGWMLEYSFGHNERGEYVEINSDHRMCGPENYRLYSDGSREQLATYMDE